MPAYIACFCRVLSGPKHSCCVTYPHAWRQMSPPAVVPRVAAITRVAMCEKCTELDSRIQKFKRYIVQPFDVLTTERMKLAVEELEAIKAELHPAHG